nr:hypothetical protein [uncultured Mucilaginibacter sp.]
MRFFILLLLFSGFCGAAFSQGRVRGKVLEEKSYIPVGGVTVENLSNHATNVSDTTGAFSIVAKPGDVLSFTSLGYKRDTVLITDMSVITAYLLPDENMLKEVKVKELEFPPGAFALKPMMGPLGSKVVRYQTDRNGNPIGGIQLSPSALFAGKKESEARMERYEKDTEITRIFNATTLGPYLPITGQELSNFIFLYKPDANTFYDKNFNISEYISACYRKFMQMPIEKRQSKTEFALK